MILAGVIVSLVGLVIVATRAFQVPGYWMPLLVGVGLVLIGTVRRLASGPRH